MCRITQITFIAINAKCVSLKPKRYLFNTTDIIEATKKAKNILSKEKYYDKYRVLPALLIKIHEVENGILL